MIWPPERRLPLGNLQNFFTLPNRRSSLPQLTGGKLSFFRCISPAPSSFCCLLPSRAPFDSMARGFSSNPNEAGPSRPRSPSSSSSSCSEVDAFRLEARRRRPGGIFIRDPSIQEDPAPAPIEAAPVSVAAPATDSSSGPSSYPSWMTRSELVELRDVYAIPSSIELSVPGPDERVTSGGPRRIAFYEDFLLAGLRFPLHPFFLSFLSQYRLVPAQLTPNSVRLLCGFLVLCSFHGFVPRLSLFRAFFQLKKCSPDVGWWYLSPRPKLLKFDLPSSIKGWKNRFFFASVEGVDFVWSEPDQISNRSSRVEAVDEGSFKMLLEGTVPAMDKLLCEQNLFEAGLSQIGPLVEDPAMKFSKDDLKSTAQQKRSAPAPEPSGTEPKKARVEAVPAPAPPSSALDKGKGVAVGPLGPSQQRAPGPEAARAVSGPERRSDRGQPSQAAPGSAGAAAASPAPTAAPSTSTPSSQAGDRQPASARPPILTETGSAIREPGLAREVFAKMVLPRDRRLRGGRSRAETLLGILPQLIAIGNDVLLVDQYDEAARKEEAEKGRKLQKLGEDVGKLQAENRGLRDRIGELEEDQRRAKAEAVELAKARSEERAIAEKHRAEDAASLSHLSKENRRLESELHLAKDESARVRKSTQLLAEQLEKSRREAQEARLEAQEAVPKFRVSKEYESELREAASDSYVKGLGECWAEAKKFLAEPELAKIAEAVGFSVSDLIKAAEPEDEPEAAAGSGPKAAEAGEGPSSTPSPGRTPAAEPGADAPPKQA